MSKQRKVHPKARARQQVYRTGRKLAFEFGYRHEPRWRELAMDLDRPALIQRAYNIFGPGDFGASVRERTLMKLTEKQKNCSYCHVKGADYHIAMIYNAPKKTNWITTTN